LIVQEQSRVIFALSDALTFEVIETAPREGGWFDREPGMIRPKLPWYIERPDFGAPISSDLASAVR
jgi:hypothetical protein